MRNKQFLYLRNDFPEFTKYKDIGYRKNIPMMPFFLNLKAENKLDDDEKIWFNTKTKEELYDVKADPHNLNNLSENPEYASALSEMKKILEAHLKGRNDFGLQAEAQMIATMWPDFNQPVTLIEDIDIKDGLITLRSKTKGASIAYLISDKKQNKLDFNCPWQLYTKPFPIAKGNYIYAIAQRIGYKESKINEVFYETE